MHPLKQLQKPRKPRRAVSRKDRAEAIQLLTSTRNSCVEAVTGEWDPVHLWVCGVHPGPGGHAAVGADDGLGCFSAVGGDQELSLVHKADWDAMDATFSGHGCVQYRDDATLRLGFSVAVSNLANLQERLRSRDADTDLLVGLEAFERPIQAPPARGICRMRLHLMQLVVVGI